MWNDSVKKREKLLRILSGSGIEIGALHRPCTVPHLDVKYVDRFTREEALEHYPELKDEAIVEVDILDDAETLETLTDGSQDFVIANHVIEHMRNPIKSLLNWGRVIKTGGCLFLAVPDKNKTFDRERKLTPLQHLIDDYRKPSRERDFDAFKEFALYVSCRTFNVRPESEYEDFAKDLFEMDYSIHYHVWEYSSFYDFLQYVTENHPAWKMQIVKSMKTIKDEFIFVLEKQR